MGLYAQTVYLFGRRGKRGCCLRNIFWYVFGLLIASPIVILALALAFYKVNNRPFVFVMESAFRYFMKDKLYIWQKKEEEVKRRGAERKIQFVGGAKFISKQIERYELGIGC